jgi:hypothetical protein
MFDVIESIDGSVRSVGNYKSADLMMIELGLSNDEVRAGLHGEIVRGRYMINFANDFLDDLGIALVLDDHPDGFGEEKDGTEALADILGITVDNLWQRITRARKKLRATHRVKRLMTEWEISAGRDQSRTKVVTKVTVTIGGVDDE